MSNLELIEKKFRESVAGIQEEWLQKESPEWYNYINGLPSDLRITYLVLILDSQVLNGGFHQYFANGYGQFAKETIGALDKIGANQKAQLLNKALEAVNVDRYDYEIFRKKLLEKKIEKLFNNRDLVEVLDNLDKQYYETEEEDIEQFLSLYLEG